MTESLQCKSPKANFASDMFSVETANVSVPNYLSSISSEHVSSLETANIAIVSSEPKMMRRIMACNITHFELSTKYSTSKRRRIKKRSRRKKRFAPAP